MAVHEELKKVLLFSNYHLDICDEKMDSFVQDTEYCIFEK